MQCIELNQFKRFTLDIKFTTVVSVQSHLSCSELVLKNEQIIYHLLIIPSKLVFKKCKLH